MATTNAITIFEPQNFGTIIQAAPQAYNENTISHQRCLQVGQELLKRADVLGMTDNLDQEIAVFIDRAKKTVKKMNGKRSAVTQLFDSIRSAYTTLENEVDPAKKGTIPAQLQELRNKYAAKKREEAERKRQEELRKQQEQENIRRYREESLGALQQIINGYVDERSTILRNILRDLTISNYDKSRIELKTFGVKTEAQTIQARYTPFVAAMYFPYLEASERTAIAESVFQEQIDQMLKSTDEIICNLRDTLLDMLPSKLQELERIAQASEEEAARIKKQIEEQERKEAEQREKERAEREAKEKAAAELAAKKHEMDDLFGAAQTQVATYQPKAQVKKRINVLNQEGFLQVVGMWWSQHGCTLTIPELEKEFKKQLTFCNKLANDKESPVFIQSEHIEYVDDVKAK